MFCIEKYQQEAGGNCSETLTASAHRDIENQSFPLLRHWPTSTGILLRHPAVSKIAFGILGFVVRHWACFLLNPLADSLEEEC